MARDFHTYTVTKRERGKRGGQIVNENVRARTAADARKRCTSKRWTVVGVKA